MIFFRWIGRSSLTSRTLGGFLNVKCIDPQVNAILRRFVALAVLLSVELSLVLHELGSWSC